MRLNDRNDGSIKALLSLVLVAANIATLSPNNNAPPPGSAGASPAVSRASRDTLGGAEIFLAGRPRSPERMIPCPIP